ncbi:ABC transporter permease [Auraticoccus monumenti]|uniref:Nucleoside ABC transporter membrane protein n=1 Tax=Auraticoccus monumenti TaxID=675864 RepID=A0A1G6XRY2_9ACTN|nr:ABC transporter permease [Auraticoccus monumenti]SDD80493.1 nucleoside ABC transporter membrane protein [Auraticoccus monumenti]
MSEPLAGTAPRRRWRPWFVRWRSQLVTALITLAAFVLAFLVGAVLMIVSDPEVISQYAYLFTAPGLPLGASWEKVSSAYAALLGGSIGGWGPITETTAQAAPLICAGLGVGLAFRAGLFNIGAQGQAVVGAMVAAWIGFTWHLPPGLHLLVAVAGGVLAGALWAGIAGWLKARAGAHEVIVTIMLNYVATGLLAFALTTTAFQRPGRSDPISPIVDWNATMPRLEGGRLHLGFVLALLAAVLVWVVMERSTAGFTIKAVGINPHASRTAGMSVPNTTVLAMLLAGGLAGLAGVQAALGPSVAGTPVPLSAGLVGSIGFDAITVALLGRSRPLGTVLAGLLFGGLHAGGLAMQSQAGTSAELTTVLQALIVLFVAAPALVTTVMPFLRARRAPLTGTTPTPTGGGLAP